MGQIEKLTILYKHHCFTLQITNFLQWEEAACAIQFVCIQSFCKIGHSTVYICIRDISFSENTWTSEKLSVPDGFTALRAVALVMSDNLGLGFTPVPQQVIHTSVHADCLPMAGQFNKTFVSS